MIAACCVKSAQTVNRMRALVQEGITEKDWTEALVKRSFEVPIERRPEDTPLTMGEFDIVKALLAKCPEVGVGKILVDKMVDLAGPGPDGAGGTHLRLDRLYCHYSHCTMGKCIRGGWLQKRISAIIFHFRKTLLCQYLNKNSMDFQFSCS